jgi:outer membrane protein insertion porin family
VVGNTKTRDKVIRRELVVAEGELYNAADMNKSRDRLKRTGYFKEVDFATSRGSTEEKINFDVKVEEAPTGALTFGVGYSTIESVIGTATVSDRNLFGLGYSGSLRFVAGFKTQNVRLSLTDPYFLGYRYTAGIDLYHERVEYFSEYSYKVTGGDIRFGKELTNSLRVDAMYKLETVDVYNVADDASTYIQEQKGKRTTSAISITPAIDTRDDYFNPRRGGQHSLFVQNAGGILGGDNYFVKVVGRTSWFFPLPFNTTLNLRAQAGTISGYGGKEIPIYEKFFVGGINTVRGFEYGKAGPLDVNGEPIGSKKMVVFNAEILFPLSSAIGLKAALFFDIGKGFDKWGDMTPLRLGAGPGIRWYSPFGPIRIDFGFNLNPKPGEKGTVLEFSGGTVY